MSRTGQVPGWTSTAPFLSASGLGKGSCPRLRTPLAVLDVEERSEMTVRGCRIPSLLGGADGNLLVRAELRGCGKAGLLSSNTVLASKAKARRGVNRWSNPGLS